MKGFAPLVLLLCLGCFHPLGWADRPEVVIDPGGVPPEALQEIMAAVDAIARLAEDQDGGEVTRLRRRAHAATVSALETQGYFSARVALDAVNDEIGEAWDIVIEPGERTQVDTVQISFQGSIAQSTDISRLQALRDQWPLPPGSPLVDSAWRDAKAHLLDAVRQRDFYFAQFAYTQATVQAQHARAALDLQVDSGPYVKLGALRVDGLQRVPATLIERYVRYTPGDAYAQDKLEEWQHALQTTPFFRGAFVLLDTSAQTDVTDDTVTLPLQVRVSEAPAQRLAASLGFDTDNKVRAEGVYRQNIVWGLPVWIETGTSLDQYEQRLFFDWHLAPDPRGHHDSFGVLVRHTDNSGLNANRYGVAWERKQTRQAAGEDATTYETQWGIIAAHETVKIDGAPQDNDRIPTVIGTWQWLRRDVDNKYDPRQGTLLDVGLSAGAAVDRSQLFYRANWRVQQWWPVGRYNTLTLRAEMGKVWDTFNRAPTDFGYRLGGARSIRGYRYQSLGLARGNAVIGAPAMALLGVEYNHYFSEDFGMAVFVDAGDAAPALSRMRWAVGYGLGARVRTPAGPFQFDLAYGQRVRGVRLHLSLGIAF